MTGRETVAFVAVPTTRPPATPPGSTRFSTTVGLADAADRRTGTYSGGMRQRLGIAQALVSRPRVLLLDEPVSALDPIGRREVLDLMSQLKGETTVFYSTHILDDVERVSDRVAILDHGRLVREAPTADLSPASPSMDDPRGHRWRRRCDRSRPGCPAGREVGRAVRRDGDLRSVPPPFTRTRLCPSSGRSRATRPTAT